jgi:hypothetical protein
VKDIPGVMMLNECTKKFKVYFEIKSPLSKNKNHYSLKNTLLRTQFSEYVDVKNLKLEIPDNFIDIPESPHFLTQNSTLIHLNLANCYICSKGFRLILAFTSNCPNLTHFGLKDNKITSINLTTAITGTYHYISLMIDLRSNQIKSFMNSITEKYFEDCTLLLWRNPIEIHEEAKLESNAYHMYIAEDGADEYFDDILYS